MHIKHHSTHKNILKQKTKQKGMLNRTQQTTTYQTKKEATHETHIKHNSTSNNTLKHNKAEKAY